MTREEQLENDESWDVVAEQDAHFIAAEKWPHNDATPRVKAGASHDHNGGTRHGQHAG